MTTHTEEIAGMRTSAERDGNGGWQVDRHIPVAILLALALQSGGALWWAASMSTRVDQLERQIVVVVRDRGPAARLHRDLDLSRGAARLLGMITVGVAWVTYQIDRSPRG